MCRGQEKKYQNPNSQLVRSGPGKGENEVHRVLRDERSGSLVCCVVNLEDSVARIGGGVGGRIRGVQTATVCLLLLLRPLRMCVYIHSSASVPVCEHLFLY